MSLELVVVILLLWGTHHATGDEYTGLLLVVVLGMLAPYMLLGVIVLVAS